MVGDVLELQAKNLAANEVQRGLHVDALTAKRSSTAGIELVTKQKAQLEKKLPEFNFIELNALPVLCERFAVANSAAVASRHIRHAAPAGPLVVKAKAWRRKLMPVAKALETNGKIQPDDLTSLGTGRGQVDAVVGLLALVKLLTPHRDSVEATCGASALSDAAHVANEALSLIGSDQKPNIDPMDLRDRYATLISRGHDRLRTAVAVLSSYREAEELVGPLVKHPHRKLKIVAPAPLPPVFGPV